MSAQPPPPANELVAWPWRVLIVAIFVGAFSWSAYEQWGPKKGAGKSPAGKSKQGTGIPEGHVFCDYCQGTKEKSWNQKANPHIWHGQCDACYGKGYLTPARVEEYRRQNERELDKLRFPDKPWMH